MAGRNFYKLWKEEQGRVTAVREYHEKLLKNYKIALLIASISNVLLIINAVIGYVQ